MATKSKEETLYGFDTYQLGAYTNKPSSEDESDDEYEEYRSAFTEFDCKCPREDEDCALTVCFDIERFFNCPICLIGDGEGWCLCSMRPHANSIHNIPLESYPREDEWLEVLKVHRENGQRD